MLAVRNLQAAYGAAQVLFDISLEIGCGEVVTLLGRNGMGKTTTVRTIMGLLRPKGGEVRFGESRLTGLPLSRVLPWRSLGGTLAASVVAAVPAAVTGLSIELPPLAALVVTSAIYGAGYLVALWVLGVLDANERATLKTWLTSPLIRSVTSVVRTEVKP